VARARKEGQVIVSSLKLTKEEIISELRRCGKDPTYFLKNYGKITHPIKGLIPFKTFPFQDVLLKDFNDHRFNIILKSRQLGISTISAGYIAWMILFYRDKNILVMATKQATAANLVKKVKAIISNVPDWMQLATIKIDNRHSLELSNGSQIKAVTTSADAGRSEALSLLVIDEAAHIDNMYELWTGLGPTLATGGRCIALSSPLGTGNWFHKTYVEAESKKNEFYATKLMWDVHPERNQEWYERETKNLSPREVAQEYLCSFNASGETVIAPEFIDRIRTICRDPERKEFLDGNLYIWKDFEDTGTYLITADVARGDGKDYSVFHVLETKTMEQVAEYQGKLDLDGFTDLLIQTGNRYNGSMIVVENNNIGYSVLMKLIERGYKNLYYTPRNADALDAFTVSSNGTAGFSTSAKTRPLIIAKLEEYVRNKTLSVNSLRTIRELETFVWRNGRPEAQSGYNDDLVMSMAIGCWVRDTAIINNERNLEYSKAFLNAITKNNSSMNTTIPGMAQYERSQRLRDIQQQYSQFSWLFKG